MNNNVTKPLALRLKEKGWGYEPPTDFHYCRGYQRDDGTWNYRLSYVPGGCYHEGMLPAPNIAEIRERLTKIDFRDYWWHKVRQGNLRLNCVDNPRDKFLLEDEYVEWLYTVTASADLLAEVWLWVTSNKKGE